MIIEEEDYIAHYGILRRSGRYPWGSGNSQSARNQSFLQIINEMKGKGLTDKEICDGFGISTTQLRAARTIAKNEQQQSKIAMAQRLKDKSLSNGAIAERMNLPGESSVRALLAPGAKSRAEVLTKTSDILKNEVDTKGFIQVGAGVEHHLGVSQTKLGAAVAMLQEQGYEKHTVKIRQLGTGLDTEVKVLCPPGTTQHDVWANQDKIKLPGAVSIDGGHTFSRMDHPPLPVDPKRVDVVYGPDGGAKADGVIYVRPGVEDLSLGGKRYGQVRIQVGDGHYLKGMAIQKDDLPEGVDLQFHTNKKDTGNKLDAMKKLTDDPQLPFGSVVRQIVADPGSPKERVTSAMNLVNEEGDWEKWSKSLSSQMLSKQSPSLAQAQLNLTYDRRKNDFDNIMALTNPTIKKKLLENFAEDVDSSAVHLKAASLPSQTTRVILPVSSMKANQVYAPTFNNGDRVVLIRYPHGGIFEIPELTVNNRNPEAKKLLSDSRDAIGIHHSVAEQLSGADFDGDTVMVIPNNHGKVKTSPPLEKLKNFNPREAYAGYEGMPKLLPRRKQQLMGDISNLITDMTIKGASHDKLARAVRHSMVVIDAENHNLDYKRSAQDHGIAQLKEEYQGRKKGGAATLISRKKSTFTLPERIERPQKQGGKVDPVTGAKVFIETGKRKPNGDLVLRRYNKLSVVSDAHSLVSDAPGTRIENIYADHSNKLKSLANRARLEALRTPSLKRVPSAAKAYAPEVESLHSKLQIAQRNAPVERQAQLIAGAVVKARQQANPSLDGDTLKKINYQELTKARDRLGAKKHKIEITQKEWDAIQAGAISNNMLGDILNNTDLDAVQKLATPRREHLMTSSKTSRAKTMLSSGYTRAEVARQLGVSLTTLDTAISG